MNSQTLIETEARPQRELSIPSETPHQFETWFEKRLTAVALVVVGFGFILRIVAAGKTYLNPDEALHFFLINQPSLYAAYKASLTNAHPPLIYVLIYFFHLVSRSELTLRLPSVLAGTAFCWVTFKWIQGLFGKAAGLAGLVLITFAPALLKLSAEVRAYALFLFCLAMSLYLLTRALAERRVITMWAFSALLYLAILSHYSAAFLALVLGIYALCRIVDTKPPRSLVSAWAAGQAGALVLYAFLYVTHISKIRSAAHSWMMEFDQSFFYPDRSNILAFTVHSTSDVFRYIFVQPIVSSVTLLLFLFGVGALFFKDLVSPAGRKRSSRSGILLLLPFVVLWLAAITKIYPYVGSRHTILLAPFAVAAIAFVIAELSRQRLWLALLIAAAIMTVSHLPATPFDFDIAGQNQDRALMSAAMHYIQNSVPPSELILADLQSTLPLSYYLCGAAEVRTGTYLNQAGEFTCDGYSVVSLNRWRLNTAGLALAIAQAAKSYGLKPGDRIWIFQAGWGGNVIADHLDPQSRCTARTFGQNISMVPFLIGQDFAPVSPSGACRK